MIRSSLIQLIGKKNEIEMLRAELVVETIFDCLKSALQRGERIEIRGLGSFHVRRYKGYKGRNPKTGEAIQVRPKLLPYFKPSKAFSGKINDRATQAAASGTVRTNRMQPSMPPPKRDPIHLDRRGTSRV
jgi:integration host factor subunit beta